MPESKVGFTTLFVQLWREHPIAMTAVSLTLLGVGFVAGFAVARLTTGGDEPPIRVKGGGSIYIEQIGPDFADLTWDTNGGTKNWKVRSGDRKSDDIGFAVWSSGDCPKVAKGVKKLNFGFLPQGATAETADVLKINAAGNKLKVDADDDLKQSQRELKYDKAGTLSSMSFQYQTGGPQTCKLNPDDEVIVFEW